ncbi:methylated-DNA-[protein]-cysteine S-methyltransferase [Aequitasia blattaphilus]|uniref:Methylated-DNA--protein-cysteine methyltransferase n=1 Tax=Aequitasia blattaphilus TaxID=2949332 RepID=A0ABT1E7C6_9FIRM|nr:methylated-DNA--[protein]-cysteine S-methyltransferase [Aequitasia blattaphilus]MCP1101735.1 methylated-DNA--[protein]-cysteine S-methyltransferase [Aequitasia blattaphilus]MCR8614375.1 methylated-DNA--[protein]-cysteine S-methyltransferase [Aequitasia blattaphilus]
MIYRTDYNSPIGIMTLASDEENLIGLWLKGQKYHGEEIFDEMIEKEDILVFAKTKEWLKNYFDGKKPDIKLLPLAPIGSEFRKEVWEILCEIPYGETITYKEIARKMAEKMGKPTMSAQAVGGAVGHNPISVIIPCHRVIGTDGSLTGYAGGIEKKRHLLEHEEGTDSN